MVYVPLYFKTNCLENYQKQLKIANNFLESIEYNTTEQKTLSTSAVAFYGSISLATPGGYVFVARNRELLKSSIGLLNEAYVSGGPLLDIAVFDLNAQGRTDITVDMLAKSIVTIDKENNFCIDDTIATPAGIIILAVEEM